MADQTLPVGFVPDAAPSVPAGFVPDTAPQMNFAIVNGKQVPLGERLADILPMAGGAIGGFHGGPLGAAVGGAAGEGYRQLVEHASEIPGAVADVVRGLATHPIATLQGFNEGAGEGMTGAAKQAGIQGVMEAAGGALMGGVSRGARSVYRGYLKPSLSKVNIGKAREIVETAFRENLPVTEGALSEAGRRIGALKDRVDSMLANASGDIDLSAVASKVRRWARTMYDRPGRAPGELDDALKVADRIDQHPSLLSQAEPWSPADVIDATRVSPSAANQVKRDLQQGVGPSQYGVQSRAGKTAEKVAASETRQAIEQVAPGVGPLNARESKLLDLARSLQRAVAREANTSKVYGVRSLWVPGFAGAEEYRRTGNPYQGAAMALATRMALSPVVMTRAALLAGQIADRVPGTAVADVARVAVQAALEAEK